MMLRPDEIARIRSKSTFSEELDDWKVPKFIFKQKDLVFPKLNGMALVNDQLDQRTIQLIDDGFGNRSAKNNSDIKSKNYEETLSSNAIKNSDVISQRERNAKNNNNFYGMIADHAPSHPPNRHRQNYSVESASAMNNRKMRDSSSILRGSARNLQELGSLRDSGTLEAAMNDFSIKKNKRI